MSGYYNGEEGNKVFWFVETRGGNQKLVRPDGTYEIIRKKHRHFAELGGQALAGWQRAMLLKQEYDIWDATAFGCTMSTMMGIRTNREENGKPIAYIFASCQTAEQAVYPFLKPEQIEECRRNVDAFYANVNLQAAWQDFILHPVCLKVVKGSKKFTPVAIESIGCGQDVLGRYEFAPIGELSCRWQINELFREKPE